MLLILSIFLFIRPFISSLTYPYLNTGYSLILLGILFLWAIDKKIDFKKLKAAKLPLLLFFCALIIASIFSLDRLNSISILYQYANGILMFIICASIDDKGRSLLTRVMLAAGIMISILAIHQYFFGFSKLADLAAREGINDPFVIDYINSRRVFAPFVTPNILAGYLAMILPIAFIVKKYWYLLILPIAMAIFFSKSLGAMAVITVAVTIYLLLDKETRKGEFAFALAGSIIVLLVVGFLRLSTQKTHLHPVFSSVMRLDYLGETLKIILHAPFKGIGPGNFTMAASRYAHNSYLQLWAECGALGMLSFIWLFSAVIDQSIKALKASARKREIACLFCATLIFLLHNLIDFSFFLSEVSLIWWVILGLLYSFSREALAES
jgi:O-antigen ligase